MPKTVLITGASGGIGSALALEYAAPGRSLILHGRNTERLDAVAVACREKGAEVHTARFDLRDRGRVMDWAREVSAAATIDLAIVNAGTNTNIGPRREGETWEASEEVVEVNLVSAMALVHTLLPAMRQRHAGQIALIGSLAGYYGLPITPSYCASKAGLKAYGESLRGWLAREGIAVNVVMPGFVESRLCDGFPGLKLWVWPADRAAKVIRRGLERNRARISFPFPLNLGCWFLTALPSGISQRILSLLY